MGVAPFIGHNAYNILAIGASTQADFKMSVNPLLILHLHYRSGPNRAELNCVGSAVQTMLAWFGPAHFSSVL